MELTINKNPDLKEQGYSLAKGSKPGTYTLVHEDETTELHGTPVTFETTSLSFDEKGLPVYAPVEENPMYMGNNLEAWLAKYGPGADGPPDAGDATRTISPEEERENVIIGEENRLNQIYIDKGFHDEDPGPPPKLEDFPIQPGDEKFVVPLDPRITAEFYNYNVYAFQEATKEWEQKKILIDLLLKKSLEGQGKSINLPCILILKQINMNIRILKLDYFQVRRFLVEQHYPNLEVKDSYNYA